MDLFEACSNRDMTGEKPLADRIRPGKLQDLIGQEHVTGPGTVLEKAIRDDRVFSMILWGPPGCGKTTLAGIIANETQGCFIRISAVLSGVKDIRGVIEKAREQRRLYRKKTLLFVDEIHRFNKSQQDAFLHHVENGLITLIGATTQNPSFEVIPALVSRCRVFSLKALDAKHVIKILKKALLDPERGLGQDENKFSPKALAHIASVSEGDARIALTNLETVCLHFMDKPVIEAEDVETAVLRKSLLYDKAGEEHYNLISAFIKSLRASDPDASIYWLERMLMAGDDPVYIIRRMVRFATEDIGMADPGALTMALNSMDAFRFLGHPEGDDVLFQAAIYLATAPKSNAVYMAHKAVTAEIEKGGYKPVPLHIRNAPTRMMKDMGYARGYKYAHDYKDAFCAQTCLPEGMEEKRFYLPSDRGYEKMVKQRLEAWIALRSKPDEPDLDR